MRVSGVQVPDGFVLKEGAVGYLCVDEYFATGPGYMYVHVVGAVDVLPMVHTKTRTWRQLQHW
jgi:hypothetical protein